MSQLTSMIEKIPVDMSRCRINWRLLAVLVFVLIGLFYFSITSDDIVVGFLSDDATYLLMAETYSPWNKNTSPLLEFLRYDFQFPPLYPLILGIIGVDSTMPETASVITTGLLLAAFAIIGLWVWVETKNYGFALLIPLILALLPSSILFSQNLLSEFLFMCFLYAAFACIGGKVLNDKNWLGAALLIGLASLTRSIGISIITAYAILLLIKRPGRALFLFMISIMPLLLWNVFRYLIADENVYWEIITNQLADSSGTELAGFIVRQLVTMGEAWYWLFSVIKGSGQYHFVCLIIASLLFALFIFSFLARLKQKKFDAICIPVYLGVILLWPFTGVHFVSRFLYPLLPLIIFYNVTGITTLLKTTARQKSGLCIYILLLITIAFPATRQFVTRAYIATDTELLPYRRSRSWMLAPTVEQALHEAVYTRELFQVLRKISDKIPVNECIYTFQTPIVMLYTQRISGSLPAPDVSDEIFSRNISACRFILATYLADSAGIYPRFYPVKRLEGNDDYKITPFYPEHSDYIEPVAFLIERVAD